MAQRPISAVARRFLALDERLRPAFATALRRFFESQAGRVIARYLGLYVSVEMLLQQPASEELLPDEERQRLWLGMLPFLVAALNGSADLAGGLVGLEAIDEADPRIGILLNELGPVVNGIHRTTLDAIRSTLAEGVSRGYTPRQVAYGVPADEYRGLRIVVEVYSGRAEAIARTELARMRQLATLERYQEGGLSLVRVSDGEGCGWNRHNDPDKADRTLRTIWAARAWPLSHVNCVRQFLPVRT